MKKVYSGSIMTIDTSRVYPQIVMHSHHNIDATFVQIYKQSSAHTVARQWFLCDMWCVTHQCARARLLACTLALLIVQCGGVQRTPFRN